MDYRIDPDDDTMRSTLAALLRDRLADPADEPDRGRRLESWRELAGSEWLEHYATALDGGPADLVAALHVAEGFGAVPVPGPVDVVAGYLVPLAAGIGWTAPVDRLRSGAVVTGTVPALDEPSASVFPARTCPRLDAGDRSQGLRVSGTVRSVIAAADAACQVVPVVVDGRPALALVDLDGPGVTVGPSAGADLGRPVAEVTLDDVAIDSDTMWVGSGLLDQEHRCAVLHSLFLDAEAVGGSTAVIARTVRHCSEREQFGRPVGSFQAVRHRLADANAKVEGARSLAHRAAWNHAAGATGASADVIASRLWAAAAYVSAAEAALQCQGGMGFTWEQGTHVFYRAALATRARSAEAHARAVLAAHLRAVAADVAVVGRPAGEPGLDEPRQVSQQAVAIGGSR